MTETRRLLIDVGNSRSKAIIAEGKHLITDSFQAWLHESEPPSALQQQVFDELLVCSVSDDRIDDWAANRKLGRYQQLVRLKSGAQHGQLINAYPQADRLGVDRWAAMAGACIERAGACCVVDLGTATTLDAIADNGQHLGGWIVPGLTTSRQALQHKGHLLSDADDGLVTHFASNTADAISSGTAHAQAATIMSFIAQMPDQNTQSVKLFLTGGHAQAVMSLLSYELIYDPLLVFRGMLALRN